MSDQDVHGAVAGDRTQMLQMQLKAALRDADEAEKAASMPSLDEARAQLSERLAPLMAERRRSLDVQLAEAQAAADARIDEARAHADAVVAEAERVAAEEAARVEAERVAAEEAARVEAERVAAEEAARVEAERVAAEEAARVEAERVAAEEAELAAAQPPSDLATEFAMAAALDAPAESPSEPPVLDDLTTMAPESESDQVSEPAVAEVAAPEEVPTTSEMPVRPTAREVVPVVLDDHDDIWREVPAASTMREVPPREAALPVAVAAAPAQVVVDAEAFARVFATVLAEVLSQRGFAQAPAVVAQPEAFRPQAPQQSFWSQARHLDVLLLGVSALIVAVVLAAWIV